MSDVALMSVLAAGTQLAQPQASVFEAPSVGSSIAGAVGTQIGNLGTQELSRSLALGPTLHVDEGTKFAAMVKTDITVQPYQTR
jgi:type IV secretory pathway VirB10-like protein